MSGVVLRCPHCGTARAAEGECDACHEATVRYYCTNHTPGRWLDTVACPTCGAKFGDRPVASVPPAPAEASSTKSRAVHVRRPAGIPSAGRVPKDSARSEAPRIPVWRPRAPDIRPTSETGTWTGSEIAPSPVDVEFAPAGRALGGCLVRMVLLVLLAIVGLFVSMFVVGGSLLGLFGFY